MDDGKSEIGAKGKIEPVMVCAEGIIFPSINQLALWSGLSRPDVVLRLKRGFRGWHVASETERLLVSDPDTRPVCKKRDFALPRTGGGGRPAVAVCAEGHVFPNLKSFAVWAGLSDEGVKLRIGRGFRGWRFATGQEALDPVDPSALPPCNGRGFPLVGAKKAFRGKTDPSVNSRAAVVVAERL